MTVKTLPRPDAGPPSSAPEPPGADSLGQDGVPQPLEGGKQASDVEGLTDGKGRRRTKWGRWNLRGWGWQGSSVIQDHSSCAVRGLARSPWTA